MTRIVPRSRPLFSWDSRPALHAEGDWRFSHFRFSVTTAQAPRNRAKAAAIEGPVIVRGKRPRISRNHRPFGRIFTVTTESVSRLPQLEHRKRSSISGTSPRPASTRACRSASAWWRHDLHHTGSRT